MALERNSFRLPWLAAWRVALGSIDTWMPLAGPAPLDDHTQTYLPHLGRESFFELL